MFHSRNYCTQHSKTVAGTKKRPHVSVVYKNISNIAQPRRLLTRRVAFRRVRARLYKITVDYPEISQRSTFRRRFLAAAIKIRFRTTRIPLNYLKKLARTVEITYQIFTFFSDHRTIFRTNYPPVGRRKPRQNDHETKLIGGCESLCPAYRIPLLIFEIHQTIISGVTEIQPHFSLSRSGAE